MRDESGEFLIGLKLNDMNLKTKTTRYVHMQSKYAYAIGHRPIGVERKQISLAVTLACLRDFFWQKKMISATRQ